MKETAEKELKAYTTIYERVNKEVKLLKQIKEAEKSVKISQAKSDRSAGRRPQSQRRSGENGEAGSRLEGSVREADRH